MHSLAESLILVACSGRRERDTHCMYETQAVSGKQPKPTFLCNRFLMEEGRAVNSDDCSLCSTREALCRCSRTWGSAIR